MKIVSSILMTALLACACHTAMADESVESFYHNKTLQFVVGYGPGGGYDIYARLVARFLGEHVPGKPSIVVRNMPGGGGRIATSYAFAKAPQDGTVLVTADQSLIVDQALGDPAIRFDMRLMPAIGNPNAENNNLVTWHTSGVRTIEDAKKKDVSIGAAQGASSQVPLALNAIIGTRFKIVLGYNGGNEINLAMERGELAGRGQNSFAAWKASKPEWLRDKKINILFQWGEKKLPEFDDVPLMTDFATNEDDRSLLQLFTVPTQLGRPIFTTPNVPKERVEALRAAFEAMMKDPEFLAAAKEMNADLNPVSGAAMESSIAQALDTPPRVLDHLRKIVETK
jgi:tripartite-type tricarboxylate transporter receptor subunit TctC